MHWQIEEKEISIEIQKLIYYPRKLYNSGGDADEIGLLAQDMLAGQVTPIFITQQNEVLDGQRRCRALLLNGETQVRAKRVNLIEDNIPFFILSANLYRTKTNFEKIKETLIILSTIKRHQGKAITLEPVTETETPNPTDTALKLPRAKLTPIEQALQLSGAEVSPRTIDKIIYIGKVEIKHPDAGLMRGIEKGDLKIDKAYIRAREIEQRNIAKNEANTKPTLHIPVHTRHYHIFNKSNWNMSEVPDESIDCSFTSHPYWDQRLYDNENEMGKEPNPNKHVDNLIKSYAEVYRATKRTGNLFVNMSDTYQLKDDEGKLVHNNIPERFVIRMGEIGWHKVKTIIWRKTSTNLVGNINKRPYTSYEPVYWFVKSPDYYYVPVPIPHNRPIIMAEKSAGRTNQDGTKTEQKMLVTRAFDTFHDVIDQTEFLDVITTNSASADSNLLRKYYGYHPAVYPVALPLLPLLQCCPPNGNFCEPFMGSGTGIVAALLLGHTCWGYETVPHLFRTAENVLADVAADIELHKAQAKVIETKFHEKFMKAA